MPVTSRTVVQVNEAVCEQLGLLIGAQGIPQDEEEITFDGFDKVETGNLLLFLVAICHQTSVPGRPPLEGIIDGRLVQGWDYLLQKFVAVARRDKAVLEPASWVTISAEQLRSLFRNSDGQGLLGDIENRAALIRDLGLVMAANGWSTIQQIYDECKGQVDSGCPNLLETLSQFRSYSDPIRKKSFFLLSLMRNTGHWTYKDPEFLGAPVDYHEVRGHLRIGTVTVNDDTLKLKLLEHLPVTAEEDIALRGAVLEAIMWLSERTGLHNPSKLHYMFWNVFRNYCTRVDPNCLGERRETNLPDRYRRLAIRHGSREACPFSNVCQSVNVENRMVEHVFDTDYY